MKIPFWGCCREFCSVREARAACCGGRISSPNLNLQLSARPHAGARCGAWFANPLPQPSGCFPPHPTACPSVFVLKRDPESTAHRQSFGIFADLEACLGNRITGILWNLFLPIWSRTVNGTVAAANFKLNESDPTPSCLGRPAESASESLEGIQCEFDHIYMCVTYSFLRSSRRPGVSFSVKWQKMLWWWLDLETIVIATTYPDFS